MASRAGPRVEGTDGSDFRHRETVAARYQTCVALKSSIRRLDAVHVLIWLLMAVQVVAGQLSLALPHESPVVTAFQWKYPYLLSIVPTALSFAALPRNNAKRLVVSVIGTGLFCVAPLLYGAMEMFPVALWLYRHGQEAYGLASGFSSLCVVMCLVMTLHGWQIYYRKKLLDQWFTSTQEKKTK